MIDCDSALRIMQNLERREKYIIDILNFIISTNYYKKSPNNLILHELSRVTRGNYCVYFRKSTIFKCKAWVTSREDSLRSDIMKCSEN